MTVSKKDLIPADRVGCGPDRAGGAPSRGALPALGSRATEGRRSHLTGAVAEAAVGRVYDRNGYRIAQRRWRGEAGEIDLIVRDDSGYVFVEVKAARTLEAAAIRLGRRQMDRIIAASCEFLATVPGGMLAEIRFDLALVDGRGEVRIVENAFGEA